MHLYSPKTILSDAISMELSYGRVLWAINLLLVGAGIQGLPVALVLEVTFARKHEEIPSLVHHCVAMPVLFQALGTWWSSHFLNSGQSKEKCPSYAPDTYAIYLIFLVYGRIWFVISDDITNSSCVWLPTKWNSWGAKREGILFYFIFSHLFLLVGG